MWPVDGVVGENGAFYFVYDRGGRKMQRRFLSQLMGNGATPERGCRQLESDHSRGGARKRGFGPINTIAKPISLSTFARTSSGCPNQPWTRIVALFEKRRGHRQGQLHPRQRLVRFL